MKVGIIGAGTMGSGIAQTFAQNDAVDTVYLCDIKEEFAEGGKGKIKNGDWNVYGLEWTPESLVWTINGVETFRHDKPAGADAFKYPWSTPFYLMIDMQLGGNWVGSVDESTLPVAMHVDWVKFYEGSRGGKKFSEFVKPKSKKK